MFDYPDGLCYYQGMKATDVTDIYSTLEAAGVDVWIDGGWCVDALLQEVSRQHSDLDVAVERSNDEMLKTALGERGFRLRDEAGSTDWNYKLENSEGLVIDVHVFAYDLQGHNVYGIKYPHGALSGVGVLAVTKVRCVNAAWMLKFKTGYPPASKDVADVRRLAAAFNLAIPEEWSEMTRGVSLLPPDRQPDAHGRRGVHRRVL